MTMRPRSFDPEAATEAAVSDLLRRFDALENPATPTAAATAAANFTGPIEATYLVAADDARDEIKEVADFVCDGTDDHVEINAAWLAVQELNIGGGRVVLSAGTFNTRDKITVNPDQTEPGVMVGAGRAGTLISMTSVTGSPVSAVRVRAGATVRDFSILVNGTATVSRGALEIDETDSKAYDISVDSDDGVGIWCDGPRSRVEGCDVITRDDATHGIFVHADASESMILNNYVIASRQHGIMIDGDAGGTPEFTQIIGNKVKDPSRQTATTYDGIHMEGPFAADHGPTIVGNVIYKGSGVDFRDGIFIAATNVVDVTVTGNTVGDGVGRWAINMDGIRSTAAGNRLMGGIDVGGNDNHIEGNLVAIVNNASNGIVVGGDRNSIFDNKVFPQSGSVPAVGLEILTGATDNVVGFNDLEQPTTDITDAGTNTVLLGTNVGSALTTKGDIHGFTTIDARLAVGTNDQIIVADSAQGIGIKWADLGVWQTWVPTYANITVGNGTVVARYVQIGDTVTAHFTFTLASASTIGTSPTISTPVTASSTYTAESNYVGGAIMLDSGTERFLGRVRLQTTTTFAPVAVTATGSFMRDSDLTATSPMTWTTSDILSFTATFEAA